MSSGNEGKSKFKTGTGLWWERDTGDQDDDNNYGPGDNSNSSGAVSANVRNRNEREDVDDAVANNDTNMRDMGSASTNADDGRSIEERTKQQQPNRLLSSSSPPSIAAAPSMPSQSSLSTTTTKPPPPSSPARRLSTTSRKPPASPNLSSRRRVAMHSPRRSSSKGGGVGFGMIGGDDDETASVGDRDDTTYDDDASTNEGGSICSDTKKDGDKTKRRKKSNIKNKADVYIREDGKKVRRVKRKKSGANDDGRDDKGGQSRSRSRSDGGDRPRRSSSSSSRSRSRCRDGKAEEEAAKKETDDAKEAALISGGKQKEPVVEAKTMPSETSSEGTSKCSPEEKESSTNDEAKAELSGDASEPLKDIVVEEKTMPSETNSAGTLKLGPAEKESSTNDEAKVELSKDASEPTKAVVIEEKTMPSETSSEGTLKRGPEEKQRSTNDEVKVELSEDAREPSKDTVAGEKKAMPSETSREGTLKRSPEESESSTNVEAEIELSGDAREPLKDIVVEEKTMPSETSSEGTLKRSPEEKESSTNVEAKVELSEDVNEPSKDTEVEEKTMPSETSSEGSLKRSPEGKKSPTSDKTKVESSENASELSNDIGSFSLPSSPPETRDEMDLHRKTTEASAAENCSDAGQTDSEQDHTVPQMDASDAASSPVADSADNLLGQDGDIVSTAGMNKDDTRKDDLEVASSTDQEKNQGDVITSRKETERELLGFDGCTGNSDDITAAVTVQDVTAATADLKEDTSTGENDMGASRAETEMHGLDGGSDHSGSVTKEKDATDESDKNTGSVLPFPHDDYSEPNLSRIDGHSADIGTTNAPGNSEDHRLVEEKEEEGDVSGPSATEAVSGDATRLASRASSISSVSGTTNTSIKAIDAHKSLPGNQTSQSETKPVGGGKCIAMGKSELNSDEKLDTTKEQKEELDAPEIDDSASKKMGVMDLTSSVVSERMDAFEVETKGESSIMDGVESKTNVSSLHSKSGGETKSDTKEVVQEVTRAEGRDGNEAPSLPSMSNASEASRTMIKDNQIDAKMAAVAVRSTSPTAKRATSPALVAASNAALDALSNSSKGGSKVKEVSAHAAQRETDPSKTLDQMREERQRQGMNTGSVAATTDVTPVKRENPFDDEHYQGGGTVGSPTPSSSEPHKSAEEAALLDAVGTSGLSTEPFVEEADVPANRPAGDIDADVPEQEMAKEDKNRNMPSPSDQDVNDSDVPPVSLSSSAAESDLCGGRMWQQAQKFAVEEQMALEEEEEERRREFAAIRSRAPPKLVATKPREALARMERDAEEMDALRHKKAKISQSLLARTRSRADVDKVVPKGIAPTLFRAAAGEREGVGLSDDMDARHPTSTDSKRQTPMRQAPQNLRLPQDNDANVLMTSKLAGKRVKVVQLLVFGLIGIVGFFLAIFVQSACHFVTATVDMGGKEPFKLHYGLWKYSPMDSVFQGYTYCSPYDNKYTTDAPRLSRISGLIALVAGSYSLCVVWVYLLLGATAEGYWKWGVRLILVAGIFQSFTFLIFTGNVCTRDECQMGPGSIASLVTTIIWFVVSYEMYHNAPMLAMLPELHPNRVRANIMDIELSDLKAGAKNFLNRLGFAHGSDEDPSSYRNHRNTERGAMDIGGSYIPPSFSSEV